MNKALIEKLRDLVGQLASQIGKQNRYHRFQLDERVLYYNWEKGWDEARIISTTGFSYTIENPDGQRMIVDGKDLKPYSEF